MWKLHRKNYLLNTINAQIAQPKIFETVDIQTFDQTFFKNFGFRNKKKKMEKFTIQVMEEILIQFMKKLAT